MIIIIVFGVVLGVVILYLILIAIGIIGFVIAGIFTSLSWIMEKLTK